MAPKVKWRLIRPYLWTSSLVERDDEGVKRHCTEQQTNTTGQILVLPKKTQPWHRVHHWARYLGGEAGGVEKACAAGKCCFFRAWIRFGRYSGSTHQREPFPLAWWKKNRQSPRIPHAHNAKLVKHGKKTKSNKQYQHFSIMLQGETVTNLESGLESLMNNRHSWPLTMWISQDCSMISKINK